MRRLSVRIREAVVEAARRNYGEAKLRMMIIGVLRDEGFVFGADGRVIDAMQSTTVESFLTVAQTQYEWIVSRSLGDMERRAVSEIFATVAPGFARVGNVILDDVVSEFRRGVESGLRTSAIENAIAGRLGAASQYAGVITQTGLKAFDTTQTIVEAARAGVEKFRLGGPGLVVRSRAWCILHYGNEYTLTEIQGMTNDVGPNPPLYHRGGWRCHHTWDPVT